MTTRRLRAIVGLAALVAVACGGEQRPAGVGTTPPTGIAKTFTTKDGSLRFEYRDPWYVFDNESDYITLLNTRTSEEEQARREANDDYSSHDGEAKIVINVGPLADLDKEKAERCRVEGTTIAVHECRTIEVNGRTALWMLLDHSNDGDCTCRIMVINGSRSSYSLGGGGCISCSQKRRIQAEIEAILRSVRLT